MVNIVPAEFVYTSLNKNGYFQGMYVLCIHTISLINLDLFQFAEEMLNSHIYKFSQNNLYSYNIITDRFRNIHIAENREILTVQRLINQGVN